MPGFGFGSERAVRRRLSIVVPPPPPVTVPLDAATPLSIGLGPRNGELAQRAIQGPALTNVFGNGAAGNTGTAAAGAIAIRVRLQPGALMANAGAQDMATAVPVLGTGSPSASRAVSCSFYPGQVGSQAGFRNRFAFYAKDYNAVQMGDRDPATGVGGATGSSRGLRSAPIVTDDSGVWHGLVILTFDGTNFTAKTCRPGDASPLAGDSFAPAGWKGLSAMTSAITFGSYAGATAAWGQYFPGDIADFIQLDGSGGTDAEWVRVANGEPPANVWPATLAAHYRLGGPIDLTKTAGSRGYGPTTLIGSGHGWGTSLRPTPGTVTAANGLHAWPLWNGYTHALSPARVRGAANAADIWNASGTLERPYHVGGAATHVDMRLIRMSDDAVVQDWTRITTAPVTGRNWAVLPNVGTSTAAGLREEFRRADDPACIAVARDNARMGLVVATSAQSQADIAFCDPTSVTLDPPASRTVSFCMMRGSGAKYTPVDGGPLAVRNQLSDAMVAFAQLWEVVGQGVPVEIVHQAKVGRGMTEFMYRSNADGFDLWGDNVTSGSGLVTTVMLAKRKRITQFLHDLSTRENGMLAAGNTLGTLATAYGSRTTTEMGWSDRIAEFYAGVAKSGQAKATEVADLATEIAERQNYQKLGLVGRPWVVMCPVSRHRDATNAVADATNAGKFDAFRKAQHDWALSGVGLSAGIDATLGAYHTDTLLGGATETAHQDRTDPRGNIRYAQRWAHAIARAAKIEPYDPDVTFTGALRSGPVITLSPTLKHAGALIVAVGGTIPTGFEVSENGGATWSAAGGPTPFTPALSGNSVTLTRAAGNWAANTQVRYLYGYPAAVGSASFAAEAALGDGMLYESYANAERPLAGAVQGVPLRPVFVPLVAA